MQSYDVLWHICMTYSPIQERKKHDVTKFRYLDKINSRGLANAFTCLVPFYFCVAYYIAPCHYN